jgi:hypothetical protein
LAAFISRYCSIIGVTRAASAGGSASDGAGNVGWIVITGTAYLKFLPYQAANSIQELQIEKRYQNHKFASAPDFPKFVKGGR